MRIDVHVGHTSQTVALPQVLRSHTAVVEDAEPCCPVAGGMVQARDGHECPFRLAVHDGIDGGKRGSDNIRGSIENAGQGRCITLVQVASALFRHARHLVDVLRGMKKQEFVDARPARPHIADPGVELRLHQLAVKHVVTVGAERMRVTKTVGRQFFTFVDKYGFTHGRYQPICYRCSIPDNARTLSITQ